MCKISPPGEASVSGSQEAAPQEPYEAGRISSNFCNNYNNSGDPVDGILLVGGKEGGRGGWPFESFPARTCVDEVLPQKNLHVMLAAAAEESGHLLFLTFFSRYHIWAVGRTRGTSSLSH